MGSRPYPRRSEGVGARMPALPKGSYRRYAGATASREQAPNAPGETLRPPDLNLAPALYMEVHAMKSAVLGGSS